MNPNPYTSSAFLAKKEKEKETDRCIQINTQDIWHRPLAQVKYTLKQYMQ